MSRESEQKIRHLAIVLQSLDAKTARSLLNQLPPPQNKAVKHAMANLGQVTAEEQKLAMASLGSVLASTSKGEPPTQRSNHTSPASELLAMRSSPGVDTVEISSSAMGQSAATPTDPSIPRPSPQQDGPWSHVLPEDMVHILSKERPNVIATVINLVSVERATAILQLLPLKLASETLAALPHLHLADPEVLADIQSELQRKIGMYQRPRNASSEGLSKLQAIVQKMPSHQQPVWTQAIAQSDPTIAQRLGWQSIAPESYSMPTGLAGDAWTEPQSNAGPMDGPTILPISTPLAGQNIQRKTPADAFRGTVANPADANSIAADLLATLPLNSHVEAINQLSSQTNKLQATSTNSNESNFDQLLELSDEDLVAVLHSSEPRTVLLALSGASKRMMNRVERLMPSKDVKRLRTRLANIGVLSLRDVDAAQSSIVSLVHAKIEDGSISPLKTVSFTAAA